MKIVSRNGSSMVVKHLGVGSWFLAFVFLAIGLWALYSQMVSQNLIIIIMGGLFSLFGAYLFVSVESSTIVLGKVSENISIKRSKIFSSKTENYSLRDISKVLVKEAISSSSRHGSSTVSYNIQLILKTTNEPVYFTNNKSTVSPMFAQKNKRIEIAKEVAGFIDVPFEYYGTPSVGEIFGLVGKFLDAVAKGKVKTKENFDKDNLNK